MRANPRAMALTLIIAACGGSDNGGSDPTEPALHDGWAVSAPSSTFLAVGVHESSFAIATLPISPATSGMGYGDVGSVVGLGPSGQTITVWVGNDGLPRRAAIGQVIVLFEGWTSTTVDIGLVSPSGEIAIIRGSPINGVAVDRLRATASAWDGNLSRITTRDWLRIGATVLDVASCATSVVAAGATFGAAGVFAGLVCGSAAYSIFTRWTVADDPAISASADAYGLVLNTVQCAGLRTGSACAQAIFSFSATAAGVAADAVLAVQDEVAIAEGALRSGSGDVQVTLTWDNTADLDLYVKDPIGETIYYGHRASTSGGQLDVDDQNGYGPENIFWPSSAAPAGAYEISIDHYSGNSPSNYTVLVQAFGFTKTYTGSLVSGQKGVVVTFQSGFPLPTASPRFSKQLPTDNRKSQGELITWVEYQ